MKQRDEKVSVRSMKRILVVFALIAALLVALLFRDAWIQIINAEEYTDMAIDQQTSDIPLEAKRGSIYDRNGKELATSAGCYTVWVRPGEIRSSCKEDRRTELASQLAVILGLDSAEITEIFESDSVLVKMAKYLEKSQADQVRDLEISGLEIVKDSKRFYPMGAFASVMLGSVNDDGAGRSGLELEYDAYLSGTAGRSITNTDVNGNLLSSGEQRVFRAQNGYNVVTTIDEMLQHYLQGAIEQGLRKTRSDSVYGIVMDPKTGEVLAMATTPTFDPNDPAEPTGEEQKKLFEAMSDEEQTNYLFQMWRNPVVSDVYEPGSTLKLVTSSSALEEGLVTPDTPFYCRGYYDVAGYRLWDAEYRAHGDLTLRSAVGNSCNPTHMQLALMLGEDRYYKYIHKYGLDQPTGIDLPGESWPIVQDKDSIGPVELANMGFGQGIAITPIQLITAVSAIGNDGKLMKPHVVKELTDDKGDVVKSFEPEVVRQVISKKTAEEMKDIMEGVVTDYGGSGAQISGYRIGGKTGTASRISEDGSYGSETDTSFIGMVPMDDPQLVVMVVCKYPKSDIYASSTAIPIVREFMENALPYMGIKKAAEDPGAEGGDYAYVPDVTGKTYKEAKSALDSYGIKYEIMPALTPDEKESEIDFTVKDQYPKPGEKIDTEQKVVLYRE